MSDIHLRRRHRIGLKRAKVAAEKIAEEMRRRYAISSEWRGNTLSFERAGMRGELRVTRDEVSLDAQLGMLLGAFRPQIEERIEQDFERWFGRETA